MKHILTLTDFSSIAENAVASAFVFASKYNCALTIYHNSNEGSYSTYHLSSNSNMNYTTVDKKDKAPTTKWKEQARKLNIEVKFIIGNGNLKKNVEHLVKEKQIDLLVMGSTGAGGKDEYIWGSNTEEIINEIDCPVLVIKKPMTDYRIDNIVFASSFDLKEREVFQYALDLLTPPQDCIIHLLSIDTLSFFTQPTAIMKEAMKNYESIAKPYKAVSHFYKDYSIDSGIRHFLEEIKPDLLIMSNKHSNPIKKFIKGSNTIRAVNHADFPVLTIDYSTK